MIPYATLNYYEHTDGYMITNQIISEFTNPIIGIFSTYVVIKAIKGII